MEAFYRIFNRDRMAKHSSFLGRSFELQLMLFLEHASFECNIQPEGQEIYTDKFCINGNVSLSSAFDYLREQQKEQIENNKKVLDSMRSDMAKISTKMSEKGTGSGGDMDMGELADIIAQTVAMEMEEAKEEIRDMVEQQTNADDFIHLDDTISRFIDKGEQEVHDLVNEEFIEFSDNFDVSCF